MFADLISPVRVKRAAMYFVAMVTAHMLQTLVFSHVSVMGVRPLFIPVFAVAVGMFEGGVWGGIFGLLSGLLLDMAFPETTVLFTVLFPSVGFCSGMLVFFSINKRFFSYVCVSVAALAITSAAQVAGLIFFSGVDPEEVLFVAGMQILLSLPLTPVIYFTIKALSGQKAS